MLKRLVLFVLIFLFVSGCSGAPEAVAPQSRNVPTRSVAATPAPGLAASPLPTVPTSPTATKASVEGAPRPSPTLDCTNGLTFVSDLTVPDGTYIARGVEVDKRWQVKNSGTCNWDSRYKLVLIAGSELGLPKEQALFPARSGSEALIRLLLVAPVGPGSYTSAWQAYSPQGEPFGDIIYVQFQVN